MKTPISWLQEFVDIDISIPELAHRLTLAGLEVEEIRYVGLPLPDEKVEAQSGDKRGVETYVTGLAWDPEKIVVGALQEVIPHPDADRLVLCRINDGDQEHTVVTGAPNLFPYKGKGPLEEPLKVVFANEGAQLYDGHVDGQEVFTLKRAKIRGVESYAMACSEKELGISDDHEGVIILDADAPTGTPLVDYMGDAVLDIALTPNIARNANILGVAREVSAITGSSLKEPSYEVLWEGPSIEGKVSIEIRSPELNPRFVFGLIENVHVGPSPYSIQYRLLLAGMRPINNIVDASNYVMLEVGEPLHAFDYDVLVERAGGKSPQIHTRLAEKSERLTTLDGVEREMDDFTVLVADEAGALSIAGVMGGAESEVGETTKNILLEGAAWNYINIRRTVASQTLVSEASFRFERGVHPAAAERGVRRCLSLMGELTGGTIAEGLVEEYPLPPERSEVRISSEDAQRWLGIGLSLDEMANILKRLEFQVDVKKKELLVGSPDHRLDIGTGTVGKADVMEEIARIYGYDRIPETMIADEIPPQYGNKALAIEELARDLLVDLGLQEIVTYRLTTPEREVKPLPPGVSPDDREYLRLENPISSERIVLRHSLLASVLEIVARNMNMRDRVAVFELGPVYLNSEEGRLPEELLRLSIVLSGLHSPPSWQGTDESRMDFYTLKGMMEAFFDGLHIHNVSVEATRHPSFHPEKCAHVLIDGGRIGVMGEVHPIVREQYRIDDYPVLAADLNFHAIAASIPAAMDIQPVQIYPPVLEDLAIVVDEGLPAEQVETVIREAGGDLLADIRLFDLYRGDQVGKGKKSLAYSLVYQAADRTLTDEEVGKIRVRIVKKLRETLGAVLRS
jgi:phenylalanyl-tRNA synthetase beta chain